MPLRDRKSETKNDINNKGAVKLLMPLKDHTASKTVAPGVASGKQELCRAETKIKISVYFPFSQKKKKENRGLSLFYEEYVCTSESADQCWVFSLFTASFRCFDERSTLKAQDKTIKFISYKEDDLILILII